MTATVQSDIVKKFRAFEKKHGPSFIWGHITAPYDGCSYLNACAIVRGDFAFILTDLREINGKGRCFRNLSRYVQELPDDLSDDACAGGCVRLEDIEEILSPERRDSGLEFHPLSELHPNVPNALVGKALDICLDLGYGALVEGRFHCAICDTDLLHADGLCYLESEFKDNGGTGIEVGAPICPECDSAHHCCMCGRECEPEGQEVDDSGHCIYCAERKECVRCGEKIDLSWNAKKADLEGFRTGLCGDCYEEVKRGEEENARYKNAEAATGTLFPE